MCSRIDVSRENSLSAMSKRGPGAVASPIPLTGRAPEQYELENSCLIIFFVSTIIVSIVFVFMSE